MPDPSRNILRTAPVTSITTIECVVGAVLTFLATHHVLGDIDVSATTQTIAPFVALALPAVFGAAKWRLVTPAIKVAELAERDGLVTDADFARISALLDDKLEAWGLEPDENDTADTDTDDTDTDDTDTDATDTDDTGDADAYNTDDKDGRHAEHRAEPSAPGGMSAGAAPN